MEGRGHNPPDWVNYLSPPNTWGIPPWELEQLDDEDETVSLWIYRWLVVSSLRKQLSG